MQTRRASKAAAAAAAFTSSIRTTHALGSTTAVTPSSPRKRPKTHTTSIMCSIGEAISFSSESSARDEMRSIVLSHINCGSQDIDTNTLGGWCLVDGLTHCVLASNGVLLPLIKEHGPPSFYIDHINDRNENTLCTENYSLNVESSSDGYKSFRSLCRIVAGQQLAGNAAKTIWRRLLNVVEATEENPTNLTPEGILSIVEMDNVEEDLRSPAGLSNAKCNCIIAIAKSFKEGTLSDGILLGGEATDGEVRSRLLNIKGLGPWSVDMFLLFQCHRSDILPVGDLAFRNGTRNIWGVKGNAKGGSLCQKKDKQVMEELHAAFAPYRSISSYYMYKCSGMKS